jgi:hypothetical protein
MLTTLTRPPQSLESAHVIGIACAVCRDAIAVAAAAGPGSPARASVHASQVQIILDAAWKKNQAGTPGAFYAAIRKLPEVTSVAAADYSDGELADGSGPVTAIVAFDDQIAPATVQNEQPAVLLSPAFGRSLLARKASYGSELAVQRSE